MPKKEPEDESVRLLDQLYRDAATRALDEPCVPDAGAHRLAALGQALADELDEPGAGGVVRLAALDLDSDRIAVMPRDRLIATLVQLHSARGEPIDDAMALTVAADADLRDAIRRLR